MNKSYLIIPALLLVGFGFIYRSASSEMARADQAKEVAASAARAADEERRRDLDRKAEADARARQDERDKADRAREAKTLADYDEAMRRLAQERDMYAAEAAKFSSEASSLDAELAQLKARKEAAGRELFELTREVELPRIELRTAELEIQRTHAMVTGRVAASSLAVVAPAVAPAK